MKRIAENGSKRQIRIPDIVSKEFNSKKQRARCRFRSKKVKQEDTFKNKNLVT